MGVKYDFLEVEPEEVICIYLYMIYRKEVPQ